MNIFRPQKPYVFHPPKYSPWLAPLFYWFCGIFMLRGKFKIRHIKTRGAERMASLVREGHSILVAPNHADHADPSLLLQVGREHGLKFHFMAAREGFESAAWQAFVLQRCGAFSVDREGADIASIKTALQILSSCQYPLVIFPEGEIWHHHEKLDALNDGVATIRLRSLAKVPAGRKSYVVPAAIRISHDPAVAASFSRRLEKLEQRVTWKPRPEKDLVERIYHLGGGLLALKEEEFLGHAQVGSLIERIARLQEALAASVEKKHQPTPSSSHLPDRIKAMRNRIRKQLTQSDPPLPTSAQTGLYDDLDTLFLASQLYSYPGQYLRENPSLDRLAETIFKLEEDVLNEAQYVGPRDAELIFDEPIDVAEFLQEHQLDPKAAVAPLTRHLSRRIQTLLDQSQSSLSPP